MTRKDFLEYVKKLKPAQFEELVFLSGFNSAYFPDKASLIEKSTLLYQDAEHKPDGLDKLCEHLEDLLGQSIHTERKPDDKANSWWTRWWRRLGFKRQQLIAADERINVNHLPAPVADIERVGRSNELRRLTRALNNKRVKLLHLYATGGEGKSALLYYWLQHLQKHDYHGVQKIFAWAFEPDQADSRRFFNAALSFFKAYQALNQDEEVMAHALVKAMQQQPCVLILDNLEQFQTAADVNAGRLHQSGLLDLLDAVKAAAGWQAPMLLISVSRQDLTELIKWSPDQYRSLPLMPLLPAEGSALLRQLGVRGDLEHASAEWSYHALSLVLLGKLVAREYGGDLTHCDGFTAQQLVYEQAAATQDRAARVLDFYTQQYWLHKDNNDPATVFMELLGVFDHSPTVVEMDALLSQAAHAAPLRDLPLARWKRIKQQLLAAGLLLPVAEPCEVWACHALIRQRFAERFRDTSPAAYRDANLVLYQYYKRTAKWLPESKAELEPLYRAMRHGCYARVYRQVLDLYHERVLRWADKGQGELEYYSMDKLGAYSQELAALRAFFPLSWTQPPSELKTGDQAWLLNQTGFCLMSLGRLTEAIAPEQMALDLYVTQQYWQNASINAQTLVDIILRLGQLQQAQKFAEQAIEYAQQAPVIHSTETAASLPAPTSGDLFKLMASHARLATCLHRLGDITAAQQQFEYAEQLQEQWQPDSPQLYALRGFQYCQLLLAIDETEACARQVLQRGEYALQIKTTTPLMDLAHNSLILARAQHRLRNLTAAREHYAQALHGIREAGKINFLPEFLIHYADFLREQGELSEAWTLLSEAQTIIERSGMLLYAVDWQLCVARWLEAGGRQPDLFTPAEHRAEAERLMANTGYVPDEYL